jgi:8-oxo-dGTP diphosphatase
VSRMNSKWSECPPRLDRWTICDKGHTHWGAIGAAGLLFCHLDRGAEPTYLLERRWSTVDHNGRWCIPGGAIRRGESAKKAAQREAAEEIGPLPSYKITRTNVQECGGGWKFYILTATVARPFLAHCVSETDAVGWFTREGMRSLSLHPGLQRWLGEH